MEEIEAAKPIININLNDRTKYHSLQNKEYELYLDKNIYLLKVEIYSNEKKYFNLNQINDISFNYYYKEYTYQESINTLLLPSQYYENISKVFKFLDIAFSKNKTSLFYDKDQKTMILSLKMPIGFDEIESKLNLNEVQLTTEELLKKLFNEIKEIKAKEYSKIDKNKENEQNEIISKLIKKNEEIEEKIKLLIKYNEENDKEKKEMQIKINCLMEENKILKNNISIYKASKNNKNERKIIPKESNEKDESKQEKIKKNEEENALKEIIKEKNIFNNDPKNLKFKKYLTYNNSSSGILYRFVVYIGLKDNIEYLAFCENIYIKIMIIKNKSIISSLKGHNSSIRVIRYFSNDKKEEYLLSCDDYCCLTIIWDIQDSFNKKYSIKANI